MVDTKSPTRSPATALTRSAKPSIVPGRVAAPGATPTFPVLAFSSITHRAWPAPSGTVDGVARFDVAVVRTAAPRTGARDVVVWVARAPSAGGPGRA